MLHPKTCKSWIKQSSSHSPKCRKDWHAAYNMKSMSRVIILCPFLHTVQSQIYNWRCWCILEKYLQRSFESFLQNHWDKSIRAKYFIKRPVPMFILHEQKKERKGWKKYNALFNEAGGTCMHRPIRWFILFTTITFTNLFSHLYYNIKSCPIITCTS